MGVLVVETEDHFLHHCPIYEVLREIMKKSVSIPDQSSLSFLVASKDDARITFICNWIATMYKRRCKDPTPAELVEEMAIDMLALDNITSVRGTV